MTPTPRRALLALPALALLVAPCAYGATPLKTVRVAQGLSFPLYATAPPGDTTRLFIVERRGTDNRGRIKILKAGAVLATPFLTTTHQLSTGQEQGLLGLAFAPDYATTGRFYINYTDSLGTTIIERHTVSANPDVANAAGTVILTVAQPFSNHNGGWIAFGPDGYLYIALGDGGSAGDPGDRAQNLNVILGKILRLDVSGATYTIPPSNPYVGVTGLDEIWSFGLRNPWRDSFDRLTGDLIVADVGQDRIEEIDVAPAATDQGKGANFGWRCFEGSLSYASSSTTPCGMCSSPQCPKVFPAYEYDHSSGRCSVIGGYVYRGCAIPDLDGTYFFGDWCTGEIWSATVQGDTLLGVTPRTAELAPGGGLSIGNVTSFGEDGRGEIYICDDDGEVYKIVPAAAVLEADMPALQATTSLGDPIGSTAPGNALLPGITPFADAGSRIVGVGYLKNALIRDCTVVSPGCLTSHMKLDPFDVDLDACADTINGTLTRRFVFTNRAAGARVLSYFDVITPTLHGDPDGAATASPAGGGSSAVLAQYDFSNPDRWIVHSGTGSAGVTYSADVDTASELAARVAADLPLAGGTSAGPANVGLALGFGFGSIAPAVRETVTVVTRIQTSPPTTVATDPSPLPPRALRVLGASPFGAELRLEVTLPRSERVSLQVFDATGRLVRTLSRGMRQGGSSPARWDGKLERGLRTPRASTSCA